MNHDVTVHAGATDCVRIRVDVPDKSALYACNAFPIGSLTVVRAVVTFVTKERSARLQQRRNIGTVRRMTIGTVFGYRLMLPEEGATLFCMAIPTRFIDGIALDQFIACRTMGVMAVRTRHFADFNRVSRNLMDISTLLPMASNADLSLGKFAENLVHGLVSFVTAIACQATVLMLAAVPVGSLGPLVTGQARLRPILFIGNRVDAFLEYDVGRGTAFDIRVALQMFLAFAVTGLAGRGARIAFDAVLGLIDREDWRGLALIMATSTNRVLLKRILSLTNL